MAPKLRAAAPAGVLPGDPREVDDFVRGMPPRLELIYRLKVLVLRPSQEADALADKAERVGMGAIARRPGRSLRLANAEGDVG
jgi:hypothetical protein